MHVGISYEVSVQYLSFQGSHHTGVRLCPANNLLRAIWSSSDDIYTTPSLSIVT